MKKLEDNIKLDYEHINAGRKLAKKAIKEARQNDIINISELIKIGTDAAWILPELCAKHMCEAIFEIRLGSVFLKTWQKGCECI